MKGMIWGCDRCGATVAAPFEIVVCDDYSPKAIRSERRRDPAGWLELADDVSVVDVCPNCVTAGERVDQLLNELDADLVFGEGDGS